MRLALPVLLLVVVASPRAQPADEASIAIDAAKIENRISPRLYGQFAEVAQAMGAHSEKITDPQEIVPALKRGLAAVESGKATVLEFITCDEGEYSKFAFR